MSNRRLQIIAFGAMVLIQWLVPANMILGREKVLDKGTPYRFKVRPVDPYDPFRGRYMTLDFEANQFNTDTLSEWMMGETVFVSLATDSIGFANIQDVTHEPPTDGSDYITAKLYYSDWRDSFQLLQILYPFDRYYMEETKAPEAERIYRESLRDSSQTAWALVHVYQGEAVLKDVLVNGVSITQLIE
ncbi:MAG: GDYXXLXY domain-containing protein [Saprospiraceae bacterium]